MLESPFPVTLLSTGMDACWSSLWNASVAEKASVFWLRSSRERDPPEEPRFDTLGLNPAWSITAFLQKLELLIANEGCPLFRVLADSMSQSSAVI